MRRRHLVPRWQRILRIMDEAFESYETEIAALRKRIVTDLKRKLRDAGAQKDGQIRSRGEGE